MLCVRLPNERGEYNAYIADLRSCKHNIKPELQNAWCRLWHTLSGIRCCIAVPTSVHPNHTASLQATQDKGMAICICILLQAAVEPQPGAGRCQCSRKAL